MSATEAGRTSDGSTTAGEVPTKPAPEVIGLSAGTPAPTPPTPTPTASQNVSADLFARAQKVMPGGVSSPVRAFKAVGGEPPFIVEARGSRITDADGRDYIDFVGSYGPLLFGHSPHFVAGAIDQHVRHGTTFGAPNPAEVHLAELVCELVPSIEMVRFVNSGTEATTSAIRLARGATGRTKIIKCAGCFHGSVDSLLVAGGSGVATLGIPDTAGVPPCVAAETIVVEFNDLAQLREAFQKYGSEVAAFIVEPVAANMGLVPPAPGYLQLARELTTKSGALLIFDEVITGFRLAAGGAQQVYGIRPDLTCLGKILGGGLPCAAYGGRRDLMQQLAPIGPVYQAGTLSGNPMAMIAGLAVLREIVARGESLYEELEKKTQRLAAGLRDAFAAAGIPAQVHAMASLLTPFLSAQPVTDYKSAKTCDTKLFAQFFHELLREGIYVPPSQFECWFLATTHAEADLKKTVDAARRAAGRAAGVGDPSQAIRIVR